MYNLTMRHTVRYTRPAKSVRSHGSRDQTEFAGLLGHVPSEKLFWKYLIINSV